MTDEPWFLLPGGRMHRATSDDYTYTTLRDAWLRHTEEGWFVEATDSYLLVRRPVEMQIPEGATEPTEGPIPRQALKYGRASRGLIVRPDEFELCDSLGGGIGIAFKRNAGELKWPDFDKLLGATTSGRVAFHVNAHLLKRVSDALGADFDGLTIEVDPANPLTQIAISAFGNPGRGCALVMPIKERQPAEGPEA